MSDATHGSTLPQSRLRLAAAVRAASLGPAFGLVMALALALALAGGGYGLWLRRQAKATEPAFREARVGREPISMTVLATGAVAPENRLEIKTPVPGRIDRVLVDEGQRVKKAQVIGWMSSTERAALLDAAASKGEAEVARWQELYKATPILAPVNGTIIGRNAEAGQTVTSADAVFVMSDRLIVKAQVDETDLSLIRLREPAIIVLDAYPGEKIAAEVAQVAYDAKTVNNVTTYEIDVVPKKTPGHMRSGMTANVAFLVADRPDALAVPTEAIFTKHEKFYVRVGSPQAIEEREIAVGISDGKRTEAILGLRENEPVQVPVLQARAPEEASSSPLSPFAKGASPAPRRGN
jgi:macrolide-specific efflux system membrane fusion protein